MGEYGQFVWPSFLTAAIVMGALVFLSLRSLRRAKKTLIGLQEPNET